MPWGPRCKHNTPEELDRVKWARHPVCPLAGLSWVPFLPYMPVGVRPMASQF